MADDKPLEKLISDAAFGTEEEIAQLKRKIAVLRGQLASLRQRWRAVRPDIAK
jgi:hypothetical protein